MECSSTGPVLSTLIQTLAGKMKGLQCVTHEAQGSDLCVFSLEVSEGLTIYMTELVDE